MEDIDKKLQKIKLKYGESDPYSPIQILTERDIDKALWEAYNLGKNECKEKSKEVDYHISPRQLKMFGNGD